MRMIVFGVAAAAALAACQPDSEKTNPAVATEEAAMERAAAAPAAGASSFTEDQARGRITEAGYTDVSALTQTADGAWQGMATMNGQSVSVTVDYQGNVTPAASGATPSPASPATPADPAAPTDPAAPADPSAPTDPAAPANPTEGTTP